MLNDLATTDVVLRDGSTVCVRQVTVEDVDTLREFLISLSSESLYFRFLGICALTRDRVRALVDNPGGTAIAAESGGRVVAFAGFYRDPAHARPCGGRIRGRRCAAGARDRHPAAGIPGGPGPRAGDPDVRRLRARRQPPHARRVPRLGLRHDHRAASAASFRCRSRCRSRRRSKRRPPRGRRRRPRPR